MRHVNPQDGVDVYDKDWGPIVVVPSKDASPKQSKHVGGSTLKSSFDDRVLATVGASTASRGELAADDLLRCLAHDLRQPISTTVIALSQLTATAGDASVDDRRELAEIAAHGVSTIARLVEQLLDLTRVVDGTIKVVREPIDLVEVTLAAVEELRLGPSDVRIHFDGDVGHPLGDGVLLERAVVNVLSNARRHSPAGRPISISWQVLGGRTTLSVVDHGPGISKKDRERIFTPFWREEPSLGTGLGLGLYLTRRFIELMGGAVSAFATDGGGLTIQISLPAATGGRHGGKGLAR